MSQSQWKQTFLGAVCLTLAAAIWGGVYVVSKVVLEVIPPFTLLILRFCIALAVLGAFTVARKERVAKKDYPLLMVIAFVGVTISIAAQFLGTKLSTAHMGALITSASPAFIAIFAVWLLKERIHLKQAAGILLATIGVIIVIGVPDQADAQSSLAGNLILFVAAISWGLYTVLSKKATQRYSSLLVTTYVALFGIIFTSPLMFWELSVTPVSWQFGWDIWIGVLYIGMISTAGAFYLWNKGFELMPAGSGAGFFFVQPIVGAFLGWLLLHEHLSVGFFAGGAFIFLGVALSTLRTRESAKNKREPMEGRPLSHYNEKQS
ncbi:EamA family transporter [Brevibacillus formosus]|uniref:Membrane protein n=1 Tax=Brevibacillus formosus TaxID=54913 RepID=A0A837KFR4_9BACL|nr:EamA family transporter [Brevibacillus formosus]KLH96630.1 membrane protein [Brevibacillus formosus]MED1960225.1 EamA family transporter [Brevibacillus formosus]PSJ99383.1 EamA family transporter [Brevibacillus formosus]GED59661.1 membrane protein [Brevibacillus formosus]